MKAMVSRIFTLGLLLLSTVSFAQESPLEVVQKQLDTYNAQDLEGFVNVFAEDAQVFVNLGDSVASMTGRAEIKARYGAMFKANPENKSILKGRMVEGNFVIDHEYIVGRDEPFTLIAIYEVKNGLIQRCWFAR